MCKVCHLEITLMTGVSGLCPEQLGAAGQGSENLHHFPDAIAEVVCGLAPAAISSLPAVLMCLLPRDPAAEGYLSNTACLVSLPED